MTWAEWVTLPENDKIQIVRNLNPYEQEGESLVHEIYQRFKHEYERQQGIYSIAYGIYHGGHYVITVALPANSQLQLPEYYQGVQVIPAYTYATPALIAKLGEDDYYHYLGEYIDRYHDEITSELEQAGLSLETAAKEQIVSVVERVKRKREG